MLAGRARLHAVASGLAFAPYAAGFGLIKPQSSPLAPPALGAGALLVATLEWSPLSELLLFAAGAGHAAGFSPVLADTVARDAPEASALLTTGALLAQAVTIATLGSLYLAGGLLWAAARIAVVCAIAASTSSRLTTSP